MIGCASEPDSLMLITSAPLGADVSVNGEILGKTPCDFRYFAGDDINGYVFEASKPGHQRVVKVCGAENGLAVPAQMFFELPPAAIEDAGVVLEPPPEPPPVKKLPPAKKESKTTIAPVKKEIPAAKPKKK